MSSDTGSAGSGFSLRTAVASNPARLRINFAKANSTRPATLVMMAVSLVFGLLTAVMLSPAFGLLFVAVAITLPFHFYRDASRKFREGDVCPGIVLSDKLVAVLTNLTMRGSLKKPAIKVMPYPLSKMTGGLPPVGTRVATVAWYRGPLKDGAWRDFSPEVIACWVTDESEIQRVTNSIPDQEWQNLDALLARIPERRAGLYKMWGRMRGRQCA